MTPNEVAEWIGVGMLGMFALALLAGLVSLFVALWRDR